MADDELVPDPQDAVAGMREKLEDLYYDNPLLVIGGVIVGVGLLVTGVVLLARRS
jgi:hypothetical protein